MVAIAIGLALLLFAVAQLLLGKTRDPITFTRVAKARHPHRYWGGLGSWLLLAIYALLAPFASGIGLTGWDFLLATLAVPVPVCIGLYMEWRRRARGGSYA